MKQRPGRATSLATRPAGPPQEPAPTTVEARSLQASAGRRIWSTLLDRRDWISYVYVPLIVPILVLAPYWATRLYRTNHLVNQLVKSLSQGGRDLDEMSRLLEQGAEPRWTGIAPEEVSTLEEPDLAGFTVIQDSWITDLRKWKPYRADQNDPNPYAYHSRRLMVMKTAENTDNNVFRWRLLPRDPNAQFRFPHQEVPVTLRKCLDAERSGSGNRTARWQAEFDFRNVPVGQFVNLIVEHEASGRFLEDDSDGETVPLNIRGDTAELTAWILMPEGKEYKDFKVIGRNRTSGNVERVNLVTEYLADDYSVVAFKRLALKAAYKYEVVWMYK
jgi:hypothetical protein